MMSLNWVYDYVYLLGGLNTLLLAVLVILVTRYTFFSASKKKQVPKVKVKTPLPEKQPRKNFAAGDQATPFGCSAEHLNEVMRCAWILHNYEPPNTEFGSGEPSVKVGKNTEEYQKNVPILGKGEPLCIPLETKGVHVKDSPLTGVLEEEDQEVDLLDLLPENIELANDEELDEDTAMSPQAMADIEAEMLDLSILNETLDEQHDTVAEGYEAKQCSSPSKLVENILATALSEVGLELLLRLVENCDENDVADSISSVAEVKEKIAGEGQSVLPVELCKERAAKSNRQENVTRHPSHSLAKNLAHGDVELASEMINKDENVHHYLTRKARVEALGELKMQLDQEISLLKSSSIDTSSLTQLSQASKTLTEEQLENEKRVQQHQLDQILAVMKQNPEIFGEMTSSDMQDQAKLYSI
ncbi:uncharacterized protein LOC143463121 isoform X2 [Clavelina lepadiformis]|uniref:uncharacterized protein LOC143463121 isoform X2 n=1 Tax=Clavelina lepadiformis TaxID=159417 RepID=UPI004040FDED